MRVRLLQKSFGKGGQGPVAQASRLWTLAPSPQPLYQFVIKRNFGRRGESCIRPKLVGEHKVRPYKGWINFRVFRMVTDSHRFYEPTEET